MRTKLPLRGHRYGPRCECNLPGSCSENVSSCCFYLYSGHFSERSPVDTDDAAEVSAVEVGRLLSQESLALKLGWYHGWLPQPCRVVADLWYFWEFFLHLLFRGEVCFLEDSC